MIRVEENEAKHGNCPFCHGLIARGEPIWECPGCETVHHLECAHENKRCTILGCRGLPPAVEERPVAAEPPRVRSTSVTPLLLAACIAAATVFSLRHGAEFREAHRQDTERERELKTIARDVEEQEWQSRREGLVRLTRSVLARDVPTASPTDRELAANEFDEAQSLYFQIQAHERIDAVRAELRAQLALTQPEDKVDALLSELARGRRR